MPTPPRTEVHDAPDDDFLIELDEELTAVQTLEADELSAIEGLDAFGADDDAPPVEPTTMMATDALQHALQMDPALLADIQRAKEAGVSLASTRIEPLPDFPQALLSLSDGREVPITKSVVILGRGREVADVLLASEKVSRQHAAIIFARGEFFIEDLNSTNGTSIDGRRIKRVRLLPDTPITIGNFSVTLLLR